MTGGQADRYKKPGFFTAVRARIERTSPGEQAPDDWQPWLEDLFPRAVAKGFGEHHEAFWEFVWGIEPETSPPPWIAIWSRGGGKSTSMELAVLSLLARGRRTFALYVCGTQDRANERLQTIAERLTAEKFAACYPALAERDLTKWGHSKGWRQDVVRTKSGKIALAAGLDSAARGLNLGGKRPDLIVLDELDGREDTPERTARKIRTLTDTILPTRALSGCAALAGQNLIIPDGVFARLQDGRARFLARRHVSGPVKAINGLETEPRDLPSGVRGDRIVSGVPTWEGQGIAECQELVDDLGLEAFLREQQHQVRDAPGAMLRANQVGVVGDVPRNPDGTPNLKAVVVGVDPPGGATECGIVAVAETFTVGAGQFASLEDASTPASAGPDVWGAAAVELAVRWGARIVAEGNYGGNMVSAIISAAAARAGEVVRVDPVFAKMDKAGRAQPARQAYQQGRLKTVGRHHEKTVQWTTWVPRSGASKSPNRIDAESHAFNSLVGPKEESRSGGMVDLGY